MLKKINIGLAIVLVIFAISILGSFFYQYYHGGNVKKIPSKAVERTQPTKRATFEAKTMTLRSNGVKIRWAGSRVQNDFLNYPSLFVSYYFENNSGKAVVPSIIFEKYFVITQANSKGEKTVLADTALPDNSKQFLGKNLLDNAQQYQANGTNMDANQFYRLESTVNPVYLNVGNKMIKINLKEATG